MAKRHSQYDRTWQCPYCKLVEIQPRIARVVAHDCPKARRLVPLKEVKS